MRNFKKFSLIILVLIVSKFTMAFGESKVFDDENSKATYNLDFVVRPWSLKVKRCNTGSVSDSIVVHATGGWMRVISKTDLLAGYATASDMSAMQVDVNSRATTASLSGYMSLSGTYANPANITSLAWGKIIGAPAFLTSYTETDNIWVAASVNYRTKTQNDALYYGIGNTSNFISRTGISATSGISYDNTTGIFTNTAADPGRIVNAATVGLSKANLNTTYPNVPVGYMVMCPSIILGGAVYIKATESGTSDVWQTVSAPPTL